MILNGSKKLTLQVLLADPGVNKATKAKETLDEFLDVQCKYLNLE